MRKVNLRNVDPAIDDPDASTWCEFRTHRIPARDVRLNYAPLLAHPTLNRHSPPEVVANFKRRVPPRLPKPRKNNPEVPQIPPPRSAIGTSPVPFSMPTGDLSPYKGGRARGFSAPGSYTHSAISQRPFGSSPLVTREHIRPLLAYPAHAL